MPIVIGAKRESDFTDPIGMLGDCHRRIEKFLNVLVRVAEQARGGEMSAEQRGAFETALRYFREAAPKHTADEEQSLFPRLRRCDDGRVRELLARVDGLEQGHVQANAAHSEIERLGSGWLSAGALGNQDAARLQGLLKDLQLFYRDHIELEDTIVFPAAASALGRTEREEIGREMAKRRGIG